MNQTISSKHTWLLLIPLLLLLVTGVVARNLNADPFWYDEVMAAQRAGEARYGGPFTLAQVWKNTAQVSDQVPGYYMLLSVWGSLVGLSEFGGRALSLLLGMLAIAGMYRLGRDLESPLTGLGAAVALSASAFFIMFLHEMRMYALVMVLAVFMLWFYWRLISGHHDRLTHIGLLLCVTGLLYSHYFSLILIAALCFYHLLFIPKNRDWWRVVLLMGSAGIFFLPWVLTSFTILGDADRITLHQVGSFGVVETLNKLVNGFSNTNFGLLVLLGLFALRGRKRAVTLGWVVLVTAFGLALVIDGWMGFLNHLRYILLLWIPLALLAGFGITQVARSGLPPGVILSILLVIGILNSIDPHQADAVDRPFKYLPWKQLAETIDGRGQPGDTLTVLTSVIGSDWGSLHKYVAAHYFYASPIQSAMLQAWPNMPDALYLERAETKVGESRRVWVGYDPALYDWRTGMYLDLLAEMGFAICGNVADTETLYLDLYARPPENASLRFGGNSGENSSDEAIHLGLLEPIPVVVQNNLPVVQGWLLGEAVPRNTYSVALHVMDTAGNLVAQMDYGLPVEAFGCTTTTLDLHDAPPGDYTLLATVYAWESGERLPAVDETTGQQGERLDLGTFRLE